MVQCRQNYVPGTNVTIDEQLLAFREWCKFRMYIPNKPAMYGVKLEMMCDRGTRYMLDCMPYLGQGTNTVGLPLGEYFGKKLTRSIHGTNRNFNMNNWFNSVPIAKQLLRQPYKLTILGTLQSNEREIPNELKNHRINNGTRRVNTCIMDPLHFFRTNLNLRKWFTCFLLVMRRPQSIQKQKSHAKPRQKVRRRDVSSQDTQWVRMRTGNTIRYSAKRRHWRRTKLKL
ncbi:unnamed protein product [Parnassius mnemosyne]|uniref:PiggyBac transposable element-derived protein domain-containing protein n=1 Tax=Parnassius mnemosyne TaxID=213953 RepID=A0AAV1LM39_9NEOP